MALSKRRAEAIITVIGEDQFTAMMDELKNDIGDKVGGAVKDVNKNWAVMATGRRRGRPTFDRSKVGRKSAGRIYAVR